MKIKGVDFPEALLNALRDEKLVVFAGAGVSMGAPANLPSFRGLAEQVAEGTGESIAESETVDQFLGRLKKSNGTEVHQIAAGCLQPDKLKPNALHRNLLRLFKETSSVKVVTTNFDCLFEAAAEAGDLFKAKPRIFEAPALPLGSRFAGIVHLHGSVSEPEEMVLTHDDFGRAYLTEADGWARRFLVGLFSTYTVLFVGYRHKDSIMTYLTPSLPPDGERKRFALVGSNDDQEHWHRMGIEPVVFPQAGNGGFTSLDTAMEGLANFWRRGVLDWQKEIDRIASGLPPKPNIDDEYSHMIDHALTRVDLTLFFVKAAKNSEWITWLDGREHLKRLFMEGELEVKDKILSHWLADQFIRDDSELLFSIISRYNGKVSQHFGNALLRQLAISKGHLEKSPFYPTGKLADPMQAFSGTGFLMVRGCEARGVLHIFRGAQKPSHFVVSGQIVSSISGVNCQWLQQWRVRLNETITPSPCHHRFVDNKPFQAISCHINQRTNFRPPRKIENGQGRVQKCLGMSLFVL